MLTLEYSQDMVIKNPIKAIKQPVHKCYTCKYITNSMFLIRNHVRRHLLPRKTFNCGESTPETYHCKDCDFKTNLTIFFKKHIQQIHLARNKNWEEPQSVKDILKSFIWRKRTFEAYSSLQRLKHQVGCLSTKEADTQKLPYKNSQVECYHCGYKTHFKLNLTAHIFKRHRHFEDWFYCDQCSFKTLNVYALKGHRQSHLTQNEIKWRHCKHCSFKTKHEASLRCHVICKHKSDDEISWFQCNQCKFKAKLRRSLNSHVLFRHTEWKDKDLSCCDKCPFKTKTKSNLASHVARQHTEWTDADLFHCDQCTFKSKYKKDIKSHNLKACSEWERRAQRRAAPRRFDN